jgi:hypothetical protein
VTDLFVSYKREDRAKVEPLVRLLREEGYVVWWDPEITAGERFDDVIGNQLEAASCVIVGWSKLSIGSRWVRDEADFALKRKKLVPLSLDGAEPPLGFRSIQTADLSDWAGAKDDARIKNLLAGVDRICGADVRDERLRRKLSITAVGANVGPGIGVEQTEGEQRTLSRPISRASWVRFSAIWAWSWPIVVLSLAGAVGLMLHRSSEIAPAKPRAPESPTPLVCASGTRISAAKDRCEPECGRGSRFNSAVNRCEEIACARGSRLNIAGNDCEPVTCARGTRLSEAGDSCETFACTRGSRLNDAGNGCEQITCERGTRLDAAGSGCELDCERGTKPNAAGGRCVPILCQQGWKLGSDGTNCVRVMPQSPLPPPPGPRRFRHRDEIFIEP